MGAKGFATNQVHTKLHKETNQSTEETQKACHATMPTNTQIKSTLSLLDTQMFNNSFGQWICLGSKEDISTSYVSYFFTSNLSFNATQDYQTHNQASLAIKTIVHTTHTLKDRFTQADYYQEPSSLDTQVCFYFIPTTTKETCTKRHSTGMATKESASIGSPPCQLDPQPTQGFSKFT